MVQKIINELLRERHFWRDVGFDELSELYMSMILRGLAISLTGLFIPVYMVRLGYDPVAIMILAAWYFTSRVVIMDILSAKTIAKFGPKHAMFIGYLMLICSTFMFLTIQHIHWPIWLIGCIWGGSASFFFIPFNVDFSKVKHSKHGGKELGYINIMEKSGAAIGPIVGGIIATYLGPQYLFLIATILLLGSLVPLFRSAEPVRPNQQVSIKGLPIMRLRRDYFSAMAIGVENTLCIFLWPIFLAVFVLVDKSVYAKVGLLSTVSVLTAIFAALTIGKIIDNRRGRALLRSNAIANSFLHLVRPFVLTYPAAFLVNIINEVVTTGYRMPYYKGLYDAADDLPGYRIAYLSSIEWLSSFAKCIVWWFLVMLTMFLSIKVVISLGFVFAAIASLLIMTERFKALNPRLHTR